MVLPDAFDGIPDGIGDVMKKISIFWLLIAALNIIFLFVDTWVMDNALEAVRDHIWIGIGLIMAYLTYKLEEKW